MNLLSKSIWILAAGVILSSCVPTKKYNQLNAEKMRTESLLSAQVADQQDQIASLTEELGEVTARRRELADQYALLQSNHEKLLSDNSAEASRMLIELQNTQRQLEERENRVAELEQMLRNREAALEMIRQKVAAALLGFEGKGLTVTQRDGKVYVSMDEKLLFRSGSFNIEPDGASAVRELATVLAQNPDIEIMVEGHTDNVTYRGSGQLQDNWDLSVKRATTIVRLITENKEVDPQRIIAAGRGEYLPLIEEDTADARQRNRRTEIVLTPKLDELLRIMESNY